MKHNWTEEERAKLREVISAGLVDGLGVAEPGKMCIEAAICYVKGLPHSDVPPCVAQADRRFAIVLNDAAWPSPESRAKHMMPLAFAQLNTIGEDRGEWVERVVLGIIRRVLPIALVACGLHVEAQACRDSTDLASARAAAAYAANAAAAAYAANAAAAAYAAAYAAANADGEGVLREAVQVAIDAYRAEGR